MREMNRVLVIGNGFDLNLGLKTSYQDYMQWLLNEPSIKQSALYEHLKRKMDLNRWIDIENELRYYSSLILEDKIISTDTQRSLDWKIRTDFRKEYFQICTLLREYLIIQERTFDLSKVFHSKALDVLNLLKDGFTTDLQVISFNYTTFLDKIIGLSMHHVHGSLDKEDFVFGIEDGENINKQHSFLYKSYNQGLNVNHLNE